MLVKEPPPGTANIKHWMTVCGSCKRRSHEAMDMDKSRAREKALEKGWQELDLSILDSGKRHEVYSYRCPACVKLLAEGGCHKPIPGII